MNMDSKIFNKMPKWKYYVFMYENGKMRPVETIPGMVEGAEKGE
jgi:hypothetical protein